MGTNRDLLDLAVAVYNARDLDGYVELYTEMANMHADGIEQYSFPAGPAAATDGLSWPPGPGATAVPREGMPGPAGLSASRRDITHICEGGVP